MLAHEALTLDLLSGGRFELSDAELLGSPHALVGTPSQIIETLRERRARYGISHISLMAGIIEPFNAVVEQLAGM